MSSNNLVIFESAVREDETQINGEGAGQMPKTSGQKLKILYLYRILSEQTDEEHPLTIREMIGQMNEFGIHAERKSVGEDLRALNSFGADIVEKSGPRGHYYLASRTFDVAELQLLADAVASSQFLTERKSQELIEKLMTLTSRPAAGVIERQIYRLNCRKHANERIYYNVDAIHKAIGECREISFLYFEYTTGKKKRYRHGGERYAVVPYALCWDNENYYMIADYPRYDSISNFRVDRMENIKLGEYREPDSRRRSFQIEDYTKGLFSMFGGEKVLAELAFENKLIGAVIDRFGRSVAVQPSGRTGWFQIRADIVVSPAFWGWLFQFGNAAAVAGPEELRRQAQTEIRKLAELYEGAGAPE